LKKDPFKQWVKRHFNHFDQNVFETIDSFFSAFRSKF
jgi:hypothetical protein